MPVLKKKSWKDRLMAAFKTGDEKEVEKIASEVKDEEESEEEREKREKEGKTEDGLKKVLDAIKALDERMDKLEAKDEDGDEDDDEDGETMDTVIGAETAGKLSDAGVKLYTGDSAKNIPALAEILAPGTKLPTFDAKTTDAQRAMALCKCQRKALDAAYQTDAGKAAIDPFLGGNKADFGRMPLPVLNAAFIGAANLMRAKNNDGTQRASMTTRDFGRTTTVSDINAKNREFYAKR